MTRVPHRLYQYANETQLYIKLSTTDSTSATSMLTSCVQEIQQWNVSMRLKLNTMKTELIWFDRRLTNSNELTSLILNTQASVATGWTGRGVFETDANSVSFLGRGGDLGHSSV